MATKDCLKCKNFFACSNELKSYGFSCHKFESKGAPLITLHDVTGANSRSALSSYDPTIADKAMQILQENELDDEGGYDTDDDGSGKLVLEEPEGKLDYETKIRNILLTEMSVPIDVTVDDSIVPKFPNFITFCMHPNGMDIEPFPMQIKLATLLYAEYCPDCTDMAWFMHDMPVNAPYPEMHRRIAFLEHGICPRCGGKKSEFIRTKRMKMYTELAAAIGQRGGKSALGAMIGCYHTHWLLKLQRPNMVYNLLPAQVLQGTFVAISFDQAIDNLWDPYSNYLTTAPWFKAYHGLLDRYQHETGQDLYRFKDTFIAYKHRRLEFKPASPNKKTLRGRTRVITLLDEIGWLDANIETSGDKIKYNAKEIHGALDRSLLTVRNAAYTLTVKGGMNDVPTGVAINISSISDARDMICYLVRQSEHSNTILGIKAATWEINPHVPRDDPQILEDYRKNPVNADRDYGSIAPVADNPFIGNFSRVEACFRGKENGLLMQYRKHKFPDGSTARYTELITATDPKKRSILAIDAGYSNNCFGFCIGHVNDDGYPVIQILGEVQPANGMVVDHTMILKHLIFPLIPKCHVSLVLSDRWQNIKFLQDIMHEFPEVVCQAWSCRYQDFVTVRQHMWDGEVILPAINFDIDTVLDFDPDEYPQIFSNDPMKHFVLQLRTVRDLGNGVGKGSSLTDDIFRAFVLCCCYLVDQDTYDMYLAEEVPEEEMERPSFIGYSQGVTGASRGAADTAVRTTSSGQFMGYSSSAKRA